MSTDNNILKYFSSALGGAAIASLGFVLFINSNSSEQPTITEEQSQVATPTTKETPRSSSRSISVSKGSSRITNNNQNVTPEQKNPQEQATEFAERALSRIRSMSKEEQEKMVQNMTRRLSHQLERLKNMTEEEREKMQQRTEAMRKHMGNGNGFMGGGMNMFSNAIQNSMTPEEKQTFKPVIDIVNEMSEYM